MNQTTSDSINQWLKQAVTQMIAQWIKQVTQLIDQIKTMDKRIKYWIKQALKKWLD